MKYLFGINAIAFFISYGTMIWSAFDKPKEGLDNPWLYMSVLGFFIFLGGSAITYFMAYSATQRRLN